MGQELAKKNLNNKEKRSMPDSVVDKVNGNKYWYDKDNRLHRTDGPAVELSSGDRHWYKNGILHREDGPAIENANGYKKWYINGKLHCEDGPAVIWVNGKREWYLNGKRIAKKEFTNMMKVNSSIKKEPLDDQPAAINSRGTKLWKNDKNELHREDGPAVEYQDGSKEWRINGKLHRLDGPAVEWKDGHKEWWVHGEKHRINGPAIEYVNGDKFWCQYDVFHRLDGPAVEYENGYKVWYKNGKCHREDGPAIEIPNGNKEWRINGEAMSEKEFLERTTSKPVKKISQESKMTTENDGTTKAWRNKDGKLHRLDGPAVECINGIKEWHVNGQFHREDGPAIEDGLGNKWWYQNGKLHRTDGPAVEDVDGRKEWYINGVNFSEQEFSRQIQNTPNSVQKLSITKKVSDKIKKVKSKQYLAKTINRAGDKCWKNKEGELHREDGPAIEYHDGTKIWYRCDKFHREDGPAVEYPSGRKEWWIDGKLHRLNGPAIIQPNGDKSWYINGIKLTEQEFIDSTSGDKPSMIVCLSGEKRWINEKNEFHRVGGPAILRPNGDEEWHQNGLLHRTDGPAVKLADGTEKWVQKGKYHRLDGPACRYSNGTKKWYVNSKLHRTDGPAIEKIDGTKKWYLNGKELTEQEFVNKTNDMSQCEADKEGNKFWMNSNYQFHRIDGPAIEHADGGKEWWINSELHRTDGPAVVLSDGTKEWWVNGENLTEEEFLDKTNPLASLGGSANKAKSSDNQDKTTSESTLSIDTLGTKFWTNSKGEKHRTDGPAVETLSGHKSWWINGKKLTEQQFLAKTQDSSMIVENGVEIWRNKKGEIHRTGGPAIKLADGTEKWLQKGKYHRLDGPAVEYPNGAKSWYLNGKKLTEQEFLDKTNPRPAGGGSADEAKPQQDSTMTTENGIKYWRNKKGEIHRTDGPAVEYSNGKKAWYQNNLYHREDGPAVEFADGTKQWWVNGKRLTEQEFQAKTKPKTQQNVQTQHTKSTMIIDAQGNQCWYLNGKLHREEGPAVVCENGDKAWWIKGERHRTDGPAIEHADGSEEWFYEGKYHRINGPALKWTNGIEEWWIHGKPLGEIVIQQEKEENPKLQPRKTPPNPKIKLKKNIARISSVGLEWTKTGLETALEQIVKAQNHININNKK